MIAALPMYDWPPLQVWNDRLWSLIAAELAVEGVTAPANLTRTDDYRDLWRRSDLLLGQTCGLPLNTALKGHVRYLATPIYDTAGCDGSTYASAIVVHAENASTDLALLVHDRLVINSADSWSGNVALRHHLNRLALAMPEPAVVSGGHLASMQAVAQGSADFAAIDAVCLGLAQRHMPNLADSLKIVGWTRPSPATPFITALQTPPVVCDALVRALRRSLAAIEAMPIRKAVLLRDVAVLSTEAYKDMDYLKVA